MDCDKCASKDQNCHRCGPHNEYKFFREKRSSGFRKLTSKKEGMAFQRRVKDAYNRSAKEQPNSGAIWFMPGDIVTEEALMECKERAGIINSKGEKTFSISKEWLIKAEEEAFPKPMLLPFAFKGDPTIYMVGKFDFFLELVQRIEQLTKMLEEKDAQSI